MKTIISLLVALLLMGGQVFAQESLCDGLEGRAYGLCRAYCVALKCHTEDQQASSKACESIRKNYVRETGLNPPLPCAEPATLSCPCYDEATLVANFSAGDRDYCYFGDEPGVGFEYFVYGTTVDHTAGAVSISSEGINSCWFGTNENKNIQNIEFYQADDCAQLLDFSYSVDRICQEE